jgi:hypothetical protein
MATTEESLTRSLAQSAAGSPGLDGAAGSADDACCEREDALHGVSSF